ncbi:FISUMP domain-containing protein [Bacteroidota bacterium]
MKKLNLLLLLMIICSLLSCEKNQQEIEQSFIACHPWPENTSETVTLITTLYWNVVNPEGETLRYDVYFGTNENPPLLKTNLSLSSYYLGMLESETTYFWKIVVNDDRGNSTEGLIWSFTVGKLFYDYRDGNCYKCVTIGTQTWMAENLNFSSINSWCYITYFEDVPNCDIYGRLYDRESANIACPDGWHLPSDDEWKTLELYLGMDELELDSLGYRNSGLVGKKLKSISGWRNDINGNNSSGFNALPGGSLGNTSFNDSYMDYSGIGVSSSFWSSSDAWCRGLTSYQITNPLNNDGVFRGHPRRNSGLSVRCIQN